MQLPPEEDRQPHHEAIIVDTKNRIQNIFKTSIIYTEAERYL